MKIDLIEVIFWFQVMWKVVKNLYFGLNLNPKSLRFENSNYLRKPLDSLSTVTKQDAAPLLNSKWSSSKISWSWTKHVTSLPFGCLTWIVSKSETVVPHGNDKIKFFILNQKTLDFEEIHFFQSANPKINCKKYISEEITRLIGRCIFVWHFFGLERLQKIFDQSWSALITT